MQLYLNRKTANNLYTHGELTVNGNKFSDTVEHTFTMLPIGSYIIRLQKFHSSHRKICIFPSPLHQHPSPNTYHPITIIDAGNSWKDSLKDNSIVIGNKKIPGAVADSPRLLNLLFERIKKTSKDVTLTIRDADCKQDMASHFWLVPSTH